MPPTSTVISGAVSVSSCARSTSSSSAGRSMLVTEVVAESVCGRFKHGKGFHVGHLLRRVGAPGREGNLHVVPGLLRRFLDGCTPAQHNQISERDLLAAGLRAVEILLDFLERLQDLREFGWFVDFPILLRCEANASSVGTTPLVGTAER